MSTPTPRTGGDHDDSPTAATATAATGTAMEGRGRRRPAVVVMTGAGHERDGEGEAAGGGGDAGSDGEGDRPDTDAGGATVPVGDASSTSPLLGSRRTATPSSSTDDDGGGGAAMAVIVPSFPGEKGPDAVMTSAAKTSRRCRPATAEEETEAGLLPRGEAPPPSVAAADEGVAGDGDDDCDGAGVSDADPVPVTEETEAELPSVAVAASAAAVDDDDGAAMSYPDPDPDNDPAVAADASAATPSIGTVMTSAAAETETTRPAVEEETEVELPPRESETPSLVAAADEKASGGMGTSQRTPAPVPPEAGEAREADADAEGGEGAGAFRDSDSSSPITAAAASRPGSTTPASTPASTPAAVTSPPPSRAAFSPGVTPPSTADADGRDPSSSSSSVRVAVRVRPLLPPEVGSSHCVSFPTPKSIRMGGSPGGATFSFDHALDTTSTQRRVYDECVSPLVSSCLAGYNATVLAYGQTGSGKTYTILGEDDDDGGGGGGGEEEGGDDGAGDSVGVIPRALRELFDRLEGTRADASAAAVAAASPTVHSPASPTSTTPPPPPPPPFDYEVRVQFLELYGEDIRDLLFHCAPPSSSRRDPRDGRRHATPGSRLAIRDAAGANADEPEVVGATEHAVESAGEALDLLALGTARRVTGATAMNEVSSRSHAIMTVVVEQTTTTTTATTTPEGDAGEGEDAGAGRVVEEVETRRSKFHFVDLAGSERQKRSLAEGKRLKEGIDINKGLLVLGNVISALGDAKKRGKTFVPYRDSKLTRLLRGSLGGNHKTLMIACVSPSSLNMEESLSCLRYANRARNIQNNAVINFDEGSRLLSELRSKVSALASELLRVRGACLSHTEECSSVDAQLFEGGAFTDAMLRSLAQGATGAVVKNVGPNFQCDAKSAQIDRRRPQSRFFGEKAATPKLCSPKEEDGKRGGVEYFDATRKTHERAGRNNENSSDNKEEKEVSLQPAPKLTSLQAALLRSSERKAEPANINKKVKVDLPFGSQEKRWAAGEGGSPLEQEEAEEQAELRATTKKYVPDSDSEVEDDIAVGRHEAASSERVEGAGSNDDDVNSSFTRRQRHMDAAISELTKTISSKEELIEQLVSSQEKYEEMQGFYEDKLREMEVLLQENEVERDDLINEMKKLEEDSQNAAALKKSLKSKERHISELRRKQTELRSLTKVSTSNVGMIANLRNEITSLKRKRIEMQKETASEKKAHAKEIRALKKEGQQRDRELNKWKQESTKRTIQAENAQKIAKLRLEEMGRVRTKYREAEQRLRMQTLKRGVMAKAGIDAVMVGRQDTTSSNSPAPSRRRTGKKSSLDVNRMRHFLDGKVSEVGKAEAAADKLAREWEGHMNLVARKEELLSGSTDETELDEQLDALKVQIQFKEQRIRQLSSRIVPPPGSAKAQKKTSLSIVLDDKDFKRMCAGNSPLSIAQATAKVLFGMVVRERKRVAGLARVASSLDQKAAEAEKSVASKEAAFRSHIDEQMQERANMARQQQEQILGLMAIVQEEAMNNADRDDMAEGGDQSLTASNLMNSPMKGAASDEKRLNHVLSVAMSLSNMRIDALERELAELSDERKLMEGYKAREEEASKHLEDTQQDCESLRRELRQLRVSLRQIKTAIGTNIPDKVNAQGSGGSGSALSKPPGTPAKVTAIIDKALHSSEGSRLDRRLEVEDDSSDSEEGDAPAWANDIMADLQLIAEGGVPPSLLKDGAHFFSDKNGVDELSQSRQHSTKRDGQKRPKKGSGNEKLQRDADVFERLTDPSNFTGIQKHCFLENDVSPTSLRDGTQVLPSSTDIDDSGHTMQQTKKTDIARRSAVNSDEQQKFQKGAGVFESMTGSDKVTGVQTSIDRDKNEAHSSKTLTGRVIDHKKPSDSIIIADNNKPFNPSVNDLIRQFDGELSSASALPTSPLPRQGSMMKVACKGSEISNQEGSVFRRVENERRTSSSEQQHSIVEGPSHNATCQGSEALPVISFLGKECESNVDFSLDPLDGTPNEGKGECQHVLDRHQEQVTAGKCHATAVDEQDTHDFEGHSQEGCTRNGFGRPERIENFDEAAVRSNQTSTSMPNAAEEIESDDNGEGRNKKEIPKLFNRSNGFGKGQQKTRNEQNAPIEAFQMDQNLTTSSALSQEGSKREDVNRLQEKSNLPRVDHKSHIDYSGNLKSFCGQDSSSRLGSPLSPVSQRLKGDGADQKYEVHRREDLMQSTPRKVPPNSRKEDPKDLFTDEKNCGDSMDEKPKMSSLQSALRRLRKKKASPRSKRPERLKDL